MRKNFLRSIENFLRQPGQPRDLYSIALVRAARNNLAQKNNLVVPLAHRLVEIANAAAFLGKFRQFVIMRREECARPNLVVQKFGHAPGDGKTVECRCSAADLVQNYQAPLGGVIDDVRSLVHLDHERRLAAGEIVICPHAGENAVHQTDLRAFRRDKAADLRHQHNQRDLTNVSGFPSHVRAGHDRQPQVLAVKRCVVRDKLFFEEILIQHRMPPVFDDELQRLIQFRPAIPEKARRFGQRTNDIENRNAGGGLLHGSKLA